MSQIHVILLMLVVAILGAPALRAESEVPVSVEEIYPLPPAKKAGAYMLVEPDYTDAHLTYSLSSRFAVGLHGIRFHRPKYEELHYAFAQLTSRPVWADFEAGQFNLYLHTGGGMANKGSGLNRVAYLVGLESDFEARHLYFNLGGRTLGAPDFNQKNQILGRAGFAPYLSAYGELRTWVLMQALYENRSDLQIEWGPLLRFNYKNVMTEFFSTFKGHFGFNFAVYY